MVNPTYIVSPNRTYEREGALSFNEQVKASEGTINAKAGHIVALVEDAWTAYPVATDVTAKSATKYGVILQDIQLTTTAKTVRVLEVGEVWEKFVRDAGITAETVSFAKLKDIASTSGLVFVNEEVAYAN